MIELLTGWLTDEQAMCIAFAYFGLCIIAVSVLVNRIPGIHDEPKDEPVNIDLGGLF